MAIYNNITGAITDIVSPRVLHLTDCPNVTGDIGALDHSNLKSLNLIRVPVSGVIPSTSPCNQFNLNGTSLTKEDIEACLDNLIIKKNNGDNKTDWEGPEGGLITFDEGFLAYFICFEDVPSISASYASVVYELEDAGWIIQVMIEDEPY